MTLQDKEGSQRHAVEACLALAQQMACEGKSEAAEQMYKKALRTAEQTSGKTSGLAGSVLIELFDFYDKQGREGEAEIVWEQLSKVMAANRDLLLEACEESRVRQKACRDEEISDAEN